jgi:hypothetical protein
MNIPRSFFHAPEPYNFSSGDFGFGEDFTHGGRFPVGIVGMAFHFADSL